MNRQSCKTCRFWHAPVATVEPYVGKVPAKGTCRRYAPSGRDVEVYRWNCGSNENSAAVFTWPTTFYFGWCGEYSEAHDVVERERMEVIE